MMGHLRMFLVIGMLMTFTVSCKRTIKGEGPFTARTVTTGAFSGVSLNIPADMTLVVSDSVKCIITSQDNIFEVIEFDTDGDVLEIKSSYNFNTEEPVSIVVSMPVVEKVQVNGSGNISFLNVAEGEELRLYVNGSGAINGKAEAREVKCTINGSGSVTLSGSSEVYSTSINGSGDVHAFNFTADEVEVDINGSGDAEVNASSRLKVNVKGSGNVIYKGQPHVETEIMGSGEIKKAE